MKLFFYCLILVAASMLAPVFASAETQYGMCACTVVEVGAASLPAPFSQNDCSGSPAPNYTDCHMGADAENPTGADVCVCRTANTSQRTFSQAKNPGECIPDFVQLQVAPGQNVLECAWAGEDPELEKGQLFSSKLRSDIRGLNTFGGKSVQQVIGTALKTIMGVLGTIALVVFIYGGLMWMMARGNTERHGLALKTLLWGAFGVAVMLSSYALVNFVFEAFL